MNTKNIYLKVKKPLIKWSMYLVAFLVSFTILVNIGISLYGSFNSFYNTNEMPKYDVGIVLGTTPRALNGLPNTYYSYRIRGAVELYREAKIKKILVSGDNRTINYNEPKAMRKSLEERGVKSEDIIEDFAGIDTYDSVIRARDIFGIHNQLFITQQFQGDRAVSIGKWNNISAHTFVVPETKDYFVRAKLYCREYLARTKMIFTLLLNMKPAITGKYEPIQ